MKKVVMLVAVVAMLFFINLKGPENQKAVVELKEGHPVSFDNSESAVNYKPESKKEELEVNLKEEGVVKKDVFDPMSLEGLTEEEKEEKILEAMLDCKEGRSKCTKVTYDIQH